MALSAVTSTSHISHDSDEDVKYPEEAVPALSSSLAPTPSSPVAPSTEVYFEKQDHGSGLCGQHAFNNLLQGPYVTNFDLAAFATELDRRERDILETTSKAESQNVSKNGDFSLDVLREACVRWALSIIPWMKPECAGARHNPETEEGYILHQGDHWIAIRKVHTVWYLLNSLKIHPDTASQPIALTDFYLSAHLSQCNDRGTQIFVVRGDWPTLGRMAPKGEDLKGQFSWHNVADISTMGAVVADQKRKREDFAVRQMQRDVRSKFSSRYSAPPGGSTRFKFSTYDSGGVEPVRYYDSGAPAVSSYYEPADADERRRRWSEMSADRSSATAIRSRPGSGLLSSLTSALTRPFKMLREGVGERQREEATAEASEKLKTRSMERRLSEEERIAKAKAVTGDAVSDLHCAPSAALPSAGKPLGSVPSTRGHLPRTLSAEDEELQMVLALSASAAEPTADIKFEYS